MPFGFLNLTKIKQKSKIEKIHKAIDTGEIKQTNKGVFAEYTKDTTKDIEKVKKIQQKGKSKTVTEEYDSGTKATYLGGTKPEDIGFREPVDCFG